MPPKKPLGRKPDLLKLSGTFESVVKKAITKGDKAKKKRPSK